MKNKWLILLVIAAVLSRFIPHMPNVTALTALALLSGSKLYSRSRFAILLPLAVMLVSDIFLGFHKIMFWVYGSFVLITLLGIFYQNEMELKSLWKYSLSSSLVFFVITNFGVWISTDMYTRTWEGLVQCYTMAIPFFRYMMVGDLLYSFVIFGTYSLVTSKALLFKTRLSGVTIPLWTRSSQKN